MDFPQIETCTKASERNDHKQFQSSKEIPIEEVQVCTKLIKQLYTKILVEIQIFQIHQLATSV